MIETKTDCNCYIYAEGTTGHGHLVEFTCRPENVEKIKAVLPLIRSIYPPVNKKINKNVQHGGYGMYTRFDIDQKKYAGGHGGYVEVLHIHNPPDGRCGIVLHKHSSCHGSCFYEFETVEQAENAWDNVFNNKKDELGAKRQVDCGVLDPWFYAMGDQHLSGDFVFPDMFYEHPVYRVNTKWLVRDCDGHVTIKTCIGAREYEEDSYSYFGDNKKRHVTKIFWDDGTSTEDRPEAPANSSHLWVCEAIKKFKELLSGKITAFEIPFVNGLKFVGKI